MNEPTNKQLIIALLESTYLMSNMITNCKTSDECETCPLFKCKLIERCEANEKMLSYLNSCKYCGHKTTVDWAQNSLICSQTGIRIMHNSEVCQHYVLEISD